MNRHLLIWIQENSVLLHASFVDDLAYEPIELDIIIDFLELLHSCSNACVEDMQLLIENAKFIVLLFKFCLNSFALQV